MTYAKHTPGPWRLDQSGNLHLDENYHCIDGGCRWYDETGEQRKPGFLITGFMSAADARLMTAAPDLLDALRELLTDMVIAQANMRSAAKRDASWEGCAEAIEPRVAAARAAIDKATGSAS